MLNILSIKRALQQVQFVAAGIIFLQESQELCGRLVFRRQQTGAADDVLQEDCGEVPQLGTFKVLELFLLLISRPRWYSGHLAVLSDPVSQHREHSHSSGRVSQRHFTFS